MRLTRLMSLEKNDIIELFKKGEYTIGHNESWSGDKAIEIPTTEWDKSYDVLLDINIEDKKLFRELTIDDVDDFEVTSDDIRLYNEYRSNLEIKCKIKNYEYEYNCITEYGFEEWLKYQDQGCIEISLYY